MFSNRKYYYAVCPFCGKSAVSTIMGTVDDNETYVHNCLNCGRWWPNPVMTVEELFANEEKDDAESNS